MTFAEWNRERRLLRYLMDAGGYFTRSQLVDLSEVIRLGSSAPIVRRRLVRWERLRWV